jgi:hypothetical protein
MNPAPQGRDQMEQLRKEVRDLISVNERLQSALAQGERLTDDEAGIVRMCAKELLEKASVSKSEGWPNTEDSQGQPAQNLFS